MQFRLHLSPKIGRLFIVYYYSPVLPIRPGLPGSSRPFYEAKSSNPTGKMCVKVMPLWLNICPLTFVLTDVKDLHVKSKQIF